MAAFSAVVVLLCVLTYQRNRVWTSPVALWRDTVEKSPRKARAHFQLAFAYFEEGRCADAVSEFHKTSQLQPPSYDLLVDWALAYDCLNQPDQAIAKLKQAAAIERSAHAYATMGMIYAKHARWSDALSALDLAEKVDPNFAMTFVYRGGVHASRREFELAVANYRHALELDPNNQPARNALQTLSARSRAGL